MTAAELGADAAPVVVLERIALPKKQKSTQILPGSPKEAAAALVEKLKIGGAGTMSGILVVLEERGGRISRIKLGGTGCRAEAWAPRRTSRAVVIGAQTEALAAEAAAKGVGKVVRVEHPLLAPYTADGYSRWPSNSSSKTEGPTQVVFPHTYQVRDYAPALAARMGQIAHRRCGRHRRRAGLYTPAHAGAA